MLRTFKKTGSWFILFILAVIAIVSFFMSRSFLLKDSNVQWQTEVGKALLSLALTAIAGGIINIIFDERTKKQAAYEKSQSQKKELLSRLRSIFDKVDSSRLLIEANQSVKTYGEQIRNNIIPSITSLYDLKRSLVDAGRSLGLDKNEVLLLRVDLHYMIAYLKTLSEEYKQNYLKLSNIQSLYEATKKRRMDALAVRYEGSNLADFETIELPNLAWKELESLRYLSEFCKEYVFNSPGYPGVYAEVFIVHFERAKKILKEELSSEKLNAAVKAEKSYVDMINDQKGNLVERIIHEKLKPNNHEISISAKVSSATV